MASPCVKQGEKFALVMSLLQKLCREMEGKNFAFSPLSLGIAFSMLVAGLRHETKKQLLDLLGYADDTDLHAMYSELIKDQELPIKIANKYVVDSKLKIQKNFQTLAKEKYQSEVELVDFAKDSQKAEAELNAWVASKTNEMIKQLLSPGTLGRDNAIVILSAVYFKGTWLNEFSLVPEEVDFKLRDGSTVKKKFMTRKSSDFKYHETDKLKMVKLPYKEAGCYMIVALPKDDGKHIDEALATMTAAEITSAIEKLNAAENACVVLTMPKFKIDYKYSNLVEHMKALGVHKLFEGGDFSDLFEDVKAPEKVSSVVHQTVIEVDELGTKAAATTGVCTTRCNPAAPPQDIRVDVDRPFVFLLAAKQLPCFMGICATPVN